MLHYLKYQMLAEIAIPVSNATRKKETEMSNHTNAQPNSSETAQAILVAIEAKLGFVPNVHRVIGEAPVALQALVALGEYFDHSSFTPAEREIIALVTSVTNQCGYCVAGHTAFAVAEGVSIEDLEAIRQGQTAKDARIEALHRFTKALVVKKGMITGSDVDAFLGAGFDQSQIFEILIGIAAKTMTNLASKAMSVPLDPAFAAHAWTPSGTKSQTSTAA